MSSFGDRLKAARNRTNLSQQKLADRLDVHKSSIVRWEADDASPPYDIIAKLCDVLDISADYLLGRSDDFTGVISVDSLPQDELLALRAYQGKNVTELVRLAMLKFNQPQGDEPKDGNG